MKKIILLVLVIALNLSSCSEDEETNKNSNISFNPPSWVQGDWFSESGSTGLRFTNNNILIIHVDSNGLIEEDRNLKNYWSLFDGAYLNETSSEDKYFAEVLLSGNEGEGDHFNLTKISNNTMSRNRGGSEWTYTKR